ncbi:MAG: hypothetical protein AAGA10_00055 [Bacteroidota bacterium]
MIERSNSSFPSLLKLLGNMIPVIGGVLIALFIENWKEDLDDKHFLTKVFDNIDKEMQGNLESLDEVIPKQERVLDTLKAYMDDESVSIANIFFEKLNGLQMASLNNVSWQAFLNSKMELVDFEDISTLSEIDESIKLMDVKIEKMMALLLASTNATDDATKEAAYISIANVLDSEYQLQKAYSAYLGKAEGE